MGERKPRKIAQGVTSVDSHKTYASLKADGSSTGSQEVYIEITEPWTWALTRGVTPYKTVLPQGTAKYDELKGLGWGPITLTVQAPSKPGTIAPETINEKIKHIYLEMGVQYSARHMGVTLYDRRVLLDGKVFPFDINRVGTDNKYTPVNPTGDGNANQGTTDTPMTALAAIKLALEFYDFEISDPASGATLDVDPDVPDNTLFHGTVSLVEGLSYLFSLIPWDMTVDTDGDFYFTDHETTDPLNVDKYYFKEELPDGDSVFVNGGPKKIRVLFERYQEQRMRYLSPDDTSAPTNDGRLFLKQVYRFPGYSEEGTLVEEKDLVSYVTEIMSDAITALGGGGATERNAPLSRAIVNQNFMDTAWGGTKLQTSPYGSGVADVEIRLAALAQDIVTVINRDHRSLYLLDHPKSGQTQNIVSNTATWDNLIFGVLGLNDKQVYRLTTDDHGAPVGSVNGKYSVVYSTPIGLDNANFNAGSEVDLARNFDSGPVPVTPQRVGTNTEDLIIRLTSSSNDFTATQVYPGWFSTLPGLKVPAKVIVDLINTNQINQTVTQWLTPRNGIMTDRYSFDMYMVARRRTGTLEERFYIHEIDTNLENADRDEFTLTATTATYAYTKWDRSRPNNIDEIASESKVLTDPIISKYNGKISGDCEIHGVEPLKDLTHPHGQIDSMSISFWAYGPTITTKLSVTDVVDGGDAVRASHEKRRSENKQNRERD